MKTTGSRALFWLVATLLFVYLICPLYWALISSLKSPDELARAPATLWPQEPTLLNYAIVLSDERLMRGLWNSALVAGAVVALTLLLGALAAYALARLRLRGKRLWLSLILSMTVFPAISIIVPLYGIIRRLQLDAIVGMSVTYLLFTLPLAIWLLTAYFRTLPDELLEAAVMDGASPLQLLVRIVLPLARPALVTVGLLTFVTAWNEYLLALTFTTTQMADRTVPVAISYYTGVGPTFGPLMAATLVVIAPVVALVLIFQDRITSGLASQVGLETAVEDVNGRRTVGAWRGVLAVALAALLLLQARSLLLGLQRAEGYLTFPYSADYGEGPLLDQAVRLARGETIYQPDLTTPPYTIANYPPLYVALQSLFVARYGPAFWYGRATSFLSIIATAVLVAMTIHALTRDRAASVVGGLLLLTIPYVAHWAPLFRIDALALALSWAGLFVIVRWPARRGSLLASALLLMAAIYTRQSYALAAPLAASGWLLTSGARRQAVVLLSTVIGLGLALLLVLTVLTGGGFFFHVVTANVNAFVWEEVGAYVTEMGRWMPILLLLGAAYLATAWRWQRQRWGLVGLYLVGSLLSALTVGKIGSNVNYLLELCAALCLAAGVLLAALRQKPLLRLVVLLLLAAQVALMAQWVSGGAYVEEHFPFPPPGGEEVLEVMRATEGLILTDEYIGLLPLAGKQVYFQPFVFTQLSRGGLWAQQPMLDALARQEFEVVILFRPNEGLVRERWTAEMLAAIESTYQPASRVGPTIIYEPRRR